MRGHLNKKEKEGIPGHAPFFQKEGKQPFFNQNLPTAGKPANVQARIRVNEPGDELEKNADKMADQVVQQMPVASPSRGGAGNLVIQRKCDECKKEEEEGMIQKQDAGAPAIPASAEIQPPPATPAVGLPAAAPPAKAPSAAKFIVEDSSTPAPNQLKRSDFMNRLKQEICLTVNASLAGTPYSSENCPYLQGAFARYMNSSPQQLEEVIQRYAPAAGAANSAEEVIQQMKLRAAAATQQFVQNGGDISGVMNMFGNVQQTLLSGLSNIGQGIGNIFFEALPGGATPISSPIAVMQNLGKGSPIAPGTRSKMESAFGASFSDVQVHTDNNASKLSQEMNARAFTVGKHIAFKSGEHRPGTITGDSLMAHELAHVMQQSGSNDISGDTQENASYNKLEKDADITAAGVVNSVWGKMGGTLQRMGENGKSIMRSGIKIQRCKSEREKEIERLGNLQSGFLEEKRKKLEEEKKKEAEEAAKKRGEVNPKIEVKVTPNDVLNNEAKKSPFTKGKADPWEKDITEADRQNYINVRAPKAWNDVVASVKGTELEKTLNGKTFKFDPKVALENGWYAWQNLGVYNFGMSWVQNVESDPKNVWPNVAHEMGGHFEYGKTYSSEIMGAVLSKLPKAERDAWLNDPAKAQEFADRYTYPETEIFSALREKRYSDPPVGPKPTYGGLKPEQNIPPNLKQIQEVLHPDVAKAVLKELRRRVDAHPEILARDKAYFVDEVKKVFGYEP